MVWSKQSLLLAVSLAAMLPGTTPRLVPPGWSCRRACLRAVCSRRVDGHRCRSRAPGPPARSAIRAPPTPHRSRSSWACWPTRPASRRPIAVIDGWGNSFGAEPVVCLSSPAQEAARALGRFGRLSVTPLLAALADPTAAVRRYAAVALGLLDDGAAAPAVPRLVATLSDADWQVRRNAVWALGETGGRRCSRRCRAR